MNKTNFLIISSLLLASCQEKPSTTPDFTRQPTSVPALESSLAPLSPPNNFPVAKVRLGRDLFHDTRLSKTNTVSCASCHNLSHGGSDGRQFSLGINGQLGSANSPSVFNSSLNFKQFWDGRASNLAEQIEGPIHNPVELGTSWPEIAAKISQDPSYIQKFNTLYPDGVTHENIVDAIVTFENTLITLDSPFDRYLKGEQQALSRAQLIGYQKFQAYGCVSCHQGVNIGGNMFQVFGVMGDYFRDRGGFYASDLGRFNVTKQENDKHVFRVPSLRNVELTAPYFHDGSAPTLEKAVQVMGKYQLGRNIPHEDVTVLVQFLKSLTGKIPGQALPERRPTSEKK